MATDTLHDPVCHMDIAPTAVVGTSTFEEKVYSFCGPACKRDFDADPKGALEAEAVHHQSEAAVGAPGEGKARPWWKLWGS